MNKIFATLILFFGFHSLLEAQGGYLKYISDTEYHNKKIKILKGDIVPFYNSTKSNKINIIFDIDTISELEKKSDNYDIAKYINQAYLSQKDAFIQSKKGGIIYINATSIEAGDTVTLISESGKQLTQLIEKREAQVNQSELGKTCRLIISNSPSIFYSADKLKQFVEPEPDQEHENSGTQTEEKKDTGWAWWYYALLGLGVCVLVLGIGIYIKKKNPNTNEVVFKGSSLTEFADQHGGLDKLSSLNKGVIPTKNEWNKLKNNEAAKAQKVKGLKGKRIIVLSEIETFHDTKDSDNDEPMTKEWEIPKETFVQPTNFGNNNELSGQLRQMENNLIREIQRISPGNNNQNEINRLRNEKTELENKLKVIETDKRNVDAKLMQMQSDKVSAENNLQTQMAETVRFQIEIKELKEKVIAVEFLKGYSESVFSYLKYCQQVSSDAFNFFNKISQQNPKQALAADHLLMKFQSAVNSIPVGDWLRTVQDIKDSGATANRQLTRSFSQIQNDSDKQKEFQRLLFSEVLTKYSSNILILAEAFKNLSRFQGSADFASEAQNTFGKHVTEIVNKAKSTGLDIKHVPLFESWEKYLGQVEDNGGERSLAYKEIDGLEKGAIAEIVSYGVKTSFEDTKTIIILA